MARTEESGDLWRVGFTKFATRMLGELVDAEFTIPLGGQIVAGQAIGSVEGFKATSDVYSVMEGAFAGKNPHLDVDACIVRSEPYRDGWLYAVNGSPEAEALDVHGYLDFLQETIGKMQAMEEAGEVEYPRD